MNRHTIVVGCLVWVLGLGTACAQRGGTFTDEAAAGLDYQIQGEYAGTIDADGTRWGGQIIALGDGKFHAVGFPGGLPGDGWDPSNQKQEVDGQLDGKQAVFKSDTFRLEVDGTVIRVIDANGSKLGELKKVRRESPTLGAKPPAGAVVLFDGSGVGAWDKGTLVDGKYLGATNCSTKEKFNDHTIHLEFRTPFMPNARGQGRGNSGVYVNHRYEVQVLDSFGLKGADNECGGIYQQKAPKLNMCFPPLAWQTYDIDFKSAKYDAAGKKTTNARITVRHNGQTIYEDLELPKETPGGIGEGPEAAGLFLQDHGNPVVFRNVWIVPAK
ncbi:MAG: DUF1080 domain-containing protein [Pirellulales bacterium]